MIRSSLARPPAAVVPDHAARRQPTEEQLGGHPLVDVSDEPVVEAVADQLLEAGRKLAHHLARDAELLVFLLAEEARAVVHRDADAPPRGQRLPCQTSTLPAGISAATLS